MFGLTRWNPFEDMFNVQREVDRLVNQVWSDLPARTSRSWSPGFQVRASDDAWTIDIPLPGIDPERVALEVAGHTVSMRVQEDNTDQRGTRLEHTITVPQFLDLDMMTASHRHGMLVLTLPLKEAVKPRRIQIGTDAGEQKQLTAA